MTANRPTLSLRALRAEGSPAAGSHQEPDQQELQDQIAQTRQELADAVQALAARTDLVARTRDKAGRAKAITGARAARAKEIAAAQAGQIRRGALEIRGNLRQSVAAQPPARRRTAAALAAVGVAVMATWLVVRGHHHEGRMWGPR